MDPSTIVLGIAGFAILMAVLYYVMEGDKRSPARDLPSTEDLEQKPELGSSEEIEKISMLSDIETDSLH